MVEKTVFRASSCGYCPRRLGYRRLGFKPLPTPDFLETSAEEGHWHEERIIGELERGEIELPEYGKIPWTIQDRQKEFALEYPTFTLTGHIEGNAIPSDRVTEKLRFEIKSMSPFEFDRWMKGRFIEFPAYGDQLTTYLIAEPLDKTIYIVKNRSTGYKDKQIIKGQPTSFDRIIGRLTLVELLAQDRELFEAEFDPDSWECKRCEFRQHCMPPLPVLAEDQEKALFKATEQWRKGKALTTEGYRLQDDAKAILRGYAELTPTQKLIFNGLATSIYAVHSVVYPKGDVEKLLSPEALAEIAKITDRRDCRVDDLEKKEVQQ